MIHKFDPNDEVSVYIEDSIGFWVSIRGDIINKAVEETVASWRDEE